MTIKSIGVLGALEPVYDKIRDRGSNDLIAYLQRVASNDYVDEGADGINPTERQNNDEDRVNRLADNVRPPA